MPTLILSPTHHSESRILRKAAQGLGWSTFRFQGDGLPAFYSGESVDSAIYCTVPNAFVVARQLDSFLLGCSSNWLPDLPEEFLKRTVMLCPLMEAKREELRRFIKPALGKSFEAAVMTGSDLDSVASHLPDDLEVHAAEVVEWEVEYRCFAADQAVKTLSPYRRGETIFSGYDRPLAGPHEEEAEAQGFANSVVEAVRCPRAFVLDVGKIKGRGWAVVESNECWGAAIYGCAPPAVLEVLLKANVSRTAATEEDRLWDYAKHYFRACPHMKTG
ncbi:MAG: ATP-grasp domain-containing protein [Verrucomicrobiota bacterium]